MAKCNQFTPLPFKRLITSAHSWWYNATVAIQSPHTDKQR